MGTLVLALRGAATIAVLTTLVGGIPRLAQAALALAIGLWAAVLAPPIAAASVAVAIHEVALGAALGVLGAVPLLAAIAAGRLVDVTTRQASGPYTALLGLLGAAVFVAIDGHVAVLTAIAESYATVPTQAGVLAAIGALIPAAVRLAVPWLITAAVVQLAVGVGTRLAHRASSHVSTSAAVPAALVMMTASLAVIFVNTIAGVIRGSL